MPILWDTNIYVMGMLEEFGGQTKVTSYPQSTVLFQIVAGLVSLILGLMNAGW